MNMKVFEYNKQTKTKGKLLGERSTCCGHGSGTVESKGDSNWTFLDTPSAKDRQGLPITADQYDTNAICFCLGEMRCGTDVAWEWVVSP
jgi:hypothetical protein